ncbi:hypothetical protein FBU31_002990 [Coemansia sp. 'formosensis']|nr:hypothetical protein FBU31_002990 [Coemansia sp. 'formosensis']
MSGNGNTAGDDPLSSLTGLGAGGGGVDGDTMNIFSSFTNDATTTTTTTGGGNVGGLGNLAAGTMGGFGMDLGAFDVPGDVSGGGVDLSSMQLINLDDVSLSSNIMGQPLGAAPDDAAAQLMARLLGPNTAAPAQQQQQQQGGLGLSGGNNQAAPANALPLAGLRSGSESSDDLGDIPLAQLALGQALPRPGGAQQNVAAMLQSQVAMQALAMPVHGGFGHVVLNAGLGDTLLAGLLPSNAPPMQQALPFLAQGAPIHGLDAVRNPLQHQQPFAPMLSLDGAALGEEETAGVHSSILPDTLAAASESTVNAHLEVALERPPADTRELLDELETIEDRLCALLATASNAIRMITGPRREAGDDGLELGAAKIKPTIKEFMHLAAEVQAAMKYQHGRLAAQGISTQAVAGFMSDVAGFERDLVCWSDAARLLASALNTALSLSSLPTL